jgi:hypothetical protein
MRQFVVITVLVTLALACSHGEESECSKYVSRLGGSNPSAVFEEIGEKKCQDAVPILKELLEKGQYQKEIVRLATDIWDPSSQSHKSEAEKFGKKKSVYVDIMRLALKHPETAVIATTNIEDWHLTDMKEDLVAFFRNDIKSTQPLFGTAYAPALRALMSEGMGGIAEQHEDIYLALLNNSPDVQGIEVNKKSAEALGVLSTKNPDAIHALIRGLFLVSKDGGTVFKESLKSLLQIGPVAVPFLIDIVESNPGDTNVKYMEEFAVKNAISEWKWRKGMRIPMLLAQLRDKRSASAIVRDIARPVIEPPNLPDNLRQDWTIAQTNRIKFDSWGIMSVANPAVMRDALKTMRDRNVEGSARLQLALGLAFSFTPEAFDTLLNVCYQPELDEDEMTEDAIMAAEKERDALGEVAKEADFVIRFLQPLAYAISPSSVDRFTDVFVDGFDENFGDQEKPEDIQEKLEQIDVKVLLGVVTACKKDIECYKSVFLGGPGKIEGNPNKYEPETISGVDERETAYVRAMARSKAALMLGRWKLGKKARQEVIKLLLEQFGALPYDDELFGDLRQIILLGIERQGISSKKYTIKLLKELIASEAKKEVEPMKVWNQRLEALLYYLNNYTPPKDEPAKKPTAASKETKPEVKKEEAAK